jgi:hypothetical protein
MHQAPFIIINHIPHPSQERMTVHQDSGAELDVLQLRNKLKKLQKKMLIKPAEESDNIGNLPEEPNVENFEAENQHSDVKEVPKKVNDECCPEDVYQKGETVGKTPFRCHECRMPFLQQKTFRTKCHCEL